jgi:hypothetical protein
MAPSILTNKFSLHVKENGKGIQDVKHCVLAPGTIFIAKEYHIILPKACLSNMFSSTVSGLLP